MKKISYLACCLLVSAAFTACNEDYTDWAAPQSNPQEEAFTASAEITPANGLNLETAASDSVAIATLSSIAEGCTLMGCSVALTVDGQTYTLPATVKDGSILVKLTELNSNVVNLYKSQKAVEREVALKLTPVVDTATGEATTLNYPEANMTITPVATSAVDTEYYLVGGPNGWAMDKTTALKMEVDPANASVFSVIVEAAEDFEFKIVPGSAVEAADAWQRALGSASVIEEPNPGLLAFRDKDGVDPGNLACTGGKKMRITINLEDYTYIIKEDLPEAMYIIGSPNNWDWTQAFTMVPITQSPGSFWSMQYFAAGSEIKFNSATAWDGGEFGFSSDVLPQASIDYARLADVGGNIAIGTAGWYLVVVTVTDASRTVEFRTPDVYLLGGLIDNAWDCNDATRFTPPADGAGDFVSPAATVAGTARICVNAVDAGSWWKSEFTLDLANGGDGSIVYRENKQVADNIGELGYICDVAVGQQVYVNFPAGNGRVE